MSGVTIYVLIFTSALAVAAGVIPLLRRLAPRLGLMDQPSARKVHRTPVPRAGGMAIFYALWIALMAFTFWFIKFDNNVTILQALIEAGRYPATVYPPWLRLIVTFVVPIALATTVPVQALRGELHFWQIAAFLLVAVVVVALALRIWRAGLRRYSGASA